ncbi:MAG TPA: Bax inhibitor-1/YccA family protein [Lapillicoccus sp.]
MASSNPVFSQVNRQIEQGYAGFGPQRGGPQPGYGYNPTGAQGVQDRMTSDQLEQMYQAPPAGPVQTGRVTFDDVIMKTLGLFVLVLAAAGGAWFLTRGNPSLLTPIWIGGMLAGLVVGLAIAFMKTVSVPLIVLYAVLEGAFVGAFSQVMEQRWPGIVMTAVVATLCTFVGMFAGYRFGLIKVTSRSRKIFGMALIGYLMFSLVNVVALMFGWTSGWGFGGSGLLGIGISLLGVGLAAYSLAVDFDDIQNAVRAGLPEKYSWLLAHGLIVTLIWLYIEMLRLLARLRGD